MPTGQGVGYAPQSETKSICTACNGAVGVEGHLDRAVLVAGLPGGEQVLAADPPPTSPATPTFGAASIRHISSRCTMIFWPKPPPVSRMMTRMRCSGMPSRREQNMRTSCGDWVAE